MVKSNSKARQTKRPAGKSDKSARSSPGKKRRRASSSASTDFPIVGVGASAGGIEAFSALLKNLPEDSNMAVVLVMHLDPSHESMLGELLARVSALPVAIVSDGMQIQRGNVYIIPPNTTMHFDGVLHLLPRRSDSKPPTTVDDFLKSLALKCKGGAIGIVLSGVGSDGADGLAAIKAEGGITFAQDDTAQYAGMPRSAIATGCVDFVLPPIKIASELCRISKHPYFGQPIVAIEGNQFAESAGFRAILRTLLQVGGVDFSLYKEATVQRRIARRMTLQQTDTFAKYATFLQEHSEEVPVLFEDILIHVTSFFREPAAFAAIGKYVVETLEVRPANYPIRVWSVGCSSGEETYSLAMTLLDHFEQHGIKGIRLQIFGTDVSDQQIDRARSGCYPVASLKGVSSARLRRYFERIEGGYQVARSIRELCIFAKHDISRDPPFSNIDLIVCRNLLIYFDQPLQRRTMALFHYALCPSGRLWLGKSETISAYASLFKSLNSRHRIYSKKQTAVQTIPDLSAVLPGLPPALRAHLPKYEQIDTRLEAERLLLKHFVPPGFVVDSELRILRFIGDTSELIRPAPGQASFNLLKLLRSELVVEVRTAIRAAQRESVPVQRRGIRIDQEGSARSIDLEVLPMQSQNLKEGVFLVLCRMVMDGEAAGSMVLTDRDNHATLSNELDTAREQLRAIVEDQEASSEELRAANEEILSSNEELQSTNEELETAKEELQSSNEELMTLNEELHTSNLELTLFANDLHNLLDGVEIPIVMLGTDLSIRRFTPTAAKVLNLIKTDVGRPLDHIRSNVDVDWARLVSQVCNTSTTLEQEVQSSDGHWYSMRIRPFKSEGKQIDGVLLAFLDINPQKRMATAVVETSEQPLIVLTSEHRLVTANPAFYRTFACKPADMEGKSFFETAQGGWGHSALRKLFKQVTDQQPFIEKHPMSIDLPAIGERELLVSIRRTKTFDSSADQWLLAIEDVTEQHRAQRLLRQKDAQVRLLGDNSLDLVGLHDLEGRNQYLSPSYTKLLGYSDEELLGHPLADLVHTKDRPQFQMAAIDEPIRTGNPVNLTVRLHNKAGRLYWFEFKVLPLLDDQGTPTQLKSAARDVTARVEALAALSAKEAELRNLAAALIEAQEQERRRIARELHDDLSQQLALLIQQVERVRSSANQEEEINGLNRIRQFADSLTLTVHNMAHQLHPSALEHLSLGEALRSFCKEYSEMTKLRVVFTQRNPIADPGIEVASCAYRVLQEALHNVELHAGVDRAQVTLTGRNGGFRLSISDRGKGFSIDRDYHAGLGLLSMHERAILIGATLNMRSAPGKGTRVELELLPAPAPEHHPEK